MFESHNAEDQKFWEQLNPAMAITEEPLKDPGQAYEIDFSKMQEHLSQLVEEGYFKADAVIPGSVTQRLADAVRAVRKAGYPPVSEILDLMEVKTFTIKFL